MAHILNPQLHLSPPTVRQRPLLERMHNSRMDPHMDKQQQQRRRRLQQRQVCRQILFTVLFLLVSESDWSITAQFSLYFIVLSELFNFQRNAEIKLHEEICKQSFLVVYSKKDLKSVYIYQYIGISKT